MNHHMKERLKDREEWNENMSKVLSSGGLCTCGISSFPATAEHHRLIEEYIQMNYPLPDDVLNELMSHMNPPASTNIFINQSIASTCQHWIHAYTCLRCCDATDGYACGIRVCMRCTNQYLARCVKGQHYVCKERGKHQACRCGIICCRGRIVCYGLRERNKCSLSCNECSVKCVTCTNTLCRSCINNNSKCYSCQRNEEEQKLTQQEQDRQRQTHGSALQMHMNMDITPSIHFKV
jgi:hypothetical protein